MSVELQPSAQLGFHRPLTQLVKRTLTVTNTNSQPVAFKVKTTAPKQYCVRPNSGRIEPNERVEVQVLLQPMKEEPPSGIKCKDKFLVQSAVITPDRETKTLADLWSSVEADVKAGKDGVVHEQKIRCVYLPPVEGGVEGESAYNGNHVDNGDTSMATSHSASGFAAVANGATPSRFEDTRTAPSSAISQKPSAGASTGIPGVNGTSGSTSTGPDVTTKATSSGLAGSSGSSGDNTAAGSAAERIKAAVPSSVEEAKAAALNAAGAVGAAATGAAASLGLTKESGGGGDTASLQRELAEAKAEIERLKAVIAQGGEGLRQRNVGAGSSSTSTSASSSSGPGAATSTVTQEGIPLPMVGAICAGVFIFTYIFF